MWQLLPKHNQAAVIKPHRDDAHTRVAKITETMHIVVLIYIRQQGGIRQAQHTLKYLGHMSHGRGPHLVLVEDALQYHAAVLAANIPEAQPKMCFYQLAMTAV